MNKDEAREKKNRKRLERKLVAVQDAANMTRVENEDEGAETSAMDKPRWTSQKRRAKSLSTSCSQSDT